MKAAWILGLALGLGLWTAGTDAAQARRHHKKTPPPAEQTAPAASSPSSSAAPDAPPAQEQISTGASSGAKVPVMVPTAPTTTQYDPAHGFPDHNGPFSAMLIVIPAGELVEFDHPAGTGRHLDRVCCAEPGARLAIKLVFIGPTADWNGNANVTYDLQVLAPDGKIYGHSDYKGMVALQGRIETSGQGLYDNRPKVVVMQFEPQDPVGHYQVKAVLHDNVAKRDLPLFAGVQLLAKGEKAAASQSTAQTPAPPAAPPAAPAPAASPPVAAQSGVTASMAPLSDDDDKPAPRKKHRRRRH